MAFFNRLGGRNLSSKGIVVIPTYNVSITSDTNQLILKDAAIAAGWNGTSQCNIIATISSGVTVYSTDNSVAALTIANISGGVSIKIINYGSIIGAGGTGGSGPYSTYKSQYAGVGHPNFNGGAAPSRFMYGLKMYWVQGTLATKGGDAISTTYPITIDNKNGVGKIGGGGGGGAACTTSTYMSEIFWGTPGITQGSGAPYSTTNITGACMAGGAGGGGQGAGACAGGSEGYSDFGKYLESDDGYNTPMIYFGPGDRPDGHSSTYGLDDAYNLRGNPGNAGSLTAAGTGGVGKDSGEGNGKVAGTGGTGGTLGAIGGSPVWGTASYGFNFYGYEDCGPSSAGSSYATSTSYGAGYPAGAYNPDNLYGGSTYYRASGGYAVRKNGKTVTFIGSSSTNIYGTIG